MRTTLLALALLVTVPAFASAQDTPRDRALAAEHVYDASFADLRTGRATEEEVYRWSIRLMTATIELGNVAAATQAHFERMVALREVVHTLIAQGALPARAELACDYYVSEARVFRVRPPTR